MDSQVEEYRQRQRARFLEAAQSQESAPAPQAIGPGTSTRQTTCCTKPSVLADGLQRQLNFAFSGKSEAEFLSMFCEPEIKKALLDWVVLSQLGEGTWGGVDKDGCDTGWSGIVEFASWFSCLGRFSPTDAHSSQRYSLPDLQPLLKHQEAMEILMLSGGCCNLQKAVEVLCRCLADDPKAQGVKLNLLVAAALCEAEGQTDSNFHADAIDYNQRLYRFMQWGRNGTVFAEFSSLTAWHLRYVLGSWHSDSDLQWAQSNVEQKYKEPNSIGMAARMVTYRLHNDKGVSVQEGLRFYDGQIATMPVIHSYGGVCGAVSKFGASACQSFGVPAMPVAQPGHCALIWRASGGKWELENGNGGWNHSTMHVGIQRTWFELGVWSDQAGVIPVMEQALSRMENYLLGEQLRWAVKILGQGPASEHTLQELRLALLTRSIEQCTYNLPAWGDFFMVLSQTRQSDMQQVRTLVRRQATAAEAAARCGPWNKGQNLSLNRPVWASADSERAGNVVDGTSSEWFPVDSSEPQCLIVNLQRPCHVSSVHVQWWGDYGSKSSLRVFSSLSNDCNSFIFHGSRQHAAAFNGWTELGGWDETTCYVKLELGKPCPDCFGLGKSYGIRRVDVYGKPECVDEELEDMQGLLLRWAEASFPKSGELLADQQGLRFVQSQIHATAM